MSLPVFVQKPYVMFKLRLEAREVLWRLWRSHVTSLALRMLGWKAEGRSCPLPLFQLRSSDSCHFKMASGPTSNSIGLEYPWSWIFCCQHCCHIHMWLPILSLSPTHIHTAWVRICPTRSCDSPNMPLRNRGGGGPSPCDTLLCPMPCQALFWSLTTAGVGGNHLPLWEESCLV